jgi:hypothetical protein
MQNTVQGAATVHPFPAIKPGHRLMPARIGRMGRMQTVYVECPVWCTQDHVANWNYDVEDITHYGDMAGMTVPTMLDPDVAHFTWSTRVACDPAAPEPSLRAAHVLIDDENPDEARLTPDMADELASELIAFAAQIRSAARTARLHNAAAGDSDPDMDEALRRVRGGAA